MKKGRGLAFGDQLSVFSFEEQNHSFPWLVRTLLLSLSLFLPPSTKRTDTVQHGKVTMFPAGSQTTLLAFRRVLPLQCEPLLTKENPSEAEGVMQTSHIALLPLFFCHFIELIERRDRRQQLSFATTIIVSHKGHSFPSGLLLLMLF